MTRERISATLQQLEQKTNLVQIVKDHPWPALGLAVGAGFLLSGSSVDVKAAATTVAATKGASSKLGTVLDEMVANLMGGLSMAFHDRVDSMVNELKQAIGAPTPGATGGTGTTGGAGRSGTGYAGAPATSDGVHAGNFGAGTGREASMGGSQPPAMGARGAITGDIPGGAAVAASGSYQPTRAD